MDFSKYWNSMYVWAATLLLLLAAVTSYSAGAFPINLAVSIFVACGLDLAIKKFLLKRDFKFPYSALISGTIVGSIVQFAASPIIPAAAAVIAIASKYLLRLKAGHIFNPAAFGLLVALIIFGAGDEWWAASTFLAPILILANWRAGKLPVAIPFFAAIALLFHFSGTAVFSFSNAYSFSQSLPFYFGFIMVSEPKTSPYERTEQIAFGILVAVLTFALSSSGVKYYYFLALLAGNFVYAIYRSYFGKPTA